MCKQTREITLKKKILSFTLSEKFTQLCNNKQIAGSETATGTDGHHLKEI